MNNLEKIIYGERINIYSNAARLEEMSDGVKGILERRNIFWEEGVLHYSFWGENSWDYYACLSEDDLVLRYHSRSRHIDTTLEGDEAVLFIAMKGLMDDLDDICEWESGGKILLEDEKERSRTRTILKRVFSHMNDNGIDFDLGYIEQKFLEEAEIYDAQVSELIVGNDDYEGMVQTFNGIKSRLMEINVGNIVHIDRADRYKDEVWFNSAVNVLTFHNTLDASRLEVSYDAENYDVNLLKGIKISMIERGKKKEVLEGEEIYNYDGLEELIGDIDGIIVTNSEAELD